MPDLRHSAAPKERIIFGVHLPSSDWMATSVGGKFQSRSKFGAKALASNFRLALLPCTLRELILESVRVLRAG
jgi:hypothetical protein